MKRLAPYMVFIIGYIGFGLMLAWMARSTNGDVFLDLSTEAVAALIAILIARLSGALSALGTFLSAMLLAIVIYAATALIYHWLAVPAGGSVGPLALLQAGGPRFWVGILVFVASPVVWLAILDRRSATAI